MDASQRNDTEARQLKLCTNQIFVLWARLLLVKTDPKRQVEAENLVSGEKVLQIRDA